MAKMMEEQAQPETRMKVRRVLLDVGPPSIAHHVSWIRAGSEILLEIGYLDHRAVLAARAAQDPSTVDVEWFVTNRFTFTVDYARQLASAFGELTRMLESVGDGERAK